MGVRVPPDAPISTKIYIHSPLRPLRSLHEAVPGLPISALYAFQTAKRPTASADAEASYNAVWLLAKAAAAAETDDPRSVKAALVQQEPLDAPQGAVWIDEQTFHSYLTPRIGRSNRNAKFDLLCEARVPVRPDPYLVHSSSRFEAAAAPSLRLVS